MNLIDLLFLCGNRRRVTTVEPRVSAEPVRLSLQDVLATREERMRRANLIPGGATSDVPLPEWKRQFDD